MTLTHYMLIDVSKKETTKILLTTDIHRVQQWGRYYKLQGRKVIAPQIDKKGFTKLDKEELQYLLWNTFGEAPPEDYKEALATALRLTTALEEDRTPLDAVKAIVNAAQPVIHGEDGDTPKKTAPKKAGRPKSGTLTGAVWELCDEFVEKYGRAPSRKEALEYCAENGGIHAATISTQFAKWKKDQEKP
jgi:hypothetical protein